MQQFFENELLGKKADSIKKLMKLVCDMTGEDVEQLTQQSMAIRNPENAKSAKAKAPKAKAKAEAAPKAAVKVKVKEEPAKPPSEPKPSKKRPKTTNGKLDPDTYLPAGWETVEKAYKTGGSVGKTYIRFQKVNGGGAICCTINQVLKRHLEDTGEDLTAQYIEMRDKKEQEKAQRRREESEKNKEMKKQKREEYIENFRAVYGALTGPLVMALPGWSGEAKHQVNCGQLCSSYYDPEGRSWKLLKDIEAHFGMLMEQGKQDTFPDFDAARDSQATDENGRVINIARQQNQVEAWTREQKKPGEEKLRRRKKELKMVDYDHYRETSHMKLFDVSKMTEKAMEQERLPDGPTLQKEAQKLLQLLIQRGFPETTQILYMRGTFKKAAGSKLINAMAGWYFRKPFEVADRSCYQRVRLIGGRPVCSDAHVFWSGHYSLWKLGALTDDKAGPSLYGEEQASAS
ncbi:unnamed protein product [Symbiodinium microadriaticum]|nr:unnamed protein product [Symbiodinium microadriaticum]